MIVLLSTFLVLAATSWTSWPTAYASADPGSIWSGRPPYLLRYAATNCGLPADLRSANQSPQEKIPFVFALPTLVGNSVGEFAPLERNKYLGLNFCCTIALTCA